MSRQVNAGSWGKDGVKNAKILLILVTLSTRLICEIFKITPWAKRPQTWACPLGKHSVYLYSDVKGGGKGA
jgi:hypothetical protein